MSETEIIIDRIKYRHIREAASVVGITSSYLSKFCREGEVRATRIDGIWFVNETSLRDLLETRAAKKREWHERLTAERIAERAGSPSVSHAGPAPHASSSRDFVSLPRSRVAPRTLHRVVAERRLREKSNRRTLAIASIGSFLFISSLAFAFSGGSPVIASRDASVASISDVGASIARRFTSFFDSIFAVNDYRIPPAWEKTVVDQPGTARGNTVSNTTNNNYVTNNNYIQTGTGSGGISERLIDGKLTALENYLTGRIELAEYRGDRQAESLADGFSDGIGGGGFDDIDITDSSFSGGSLSGSSWSGGSITGTSITSSSFEGDATTTNLYIDGSFGFGSGTGLLHTTNGTASTLSNGSNGQVLKMVGGSLAWSTDLTGGGGGGASFFASTTDDLAIYPADPSQVVIIGESATTTVGNILEIAGNALLRGGVTTYGPLTAPRFVATSSTSSVFPYASTTALSTNSLCINGDCRQAWTADSAFSTTSADYWQTQRNFFSTTSADAWKDQRNFFSTSSAAYFSSVGLGFSTTSSDYWKSVNDFFSTTSADYYKSVSNFFSTTSADAWKLSRDFFSTTSASYFLMQNGALGFSTTSANYFVSSSTTLPKTYSANTFTALQTFGNASSSVLSADTICLSTDCRTSWPVTGSSFAYPFFGTGNSTSTLTQFNGGLTAFASSTIGNGTAAGGLTVNGTATTSRLVVTGTGTSTFAGGILMDGSIVPSIDDTYSLGSPSFQWRDVYIGPGSLYINGQKVLEDNGPNIVVTADAGQNIAIQSQGTGDIELSPLGTGVIQLKGGVQLTAGNALTMSDNSPVSMLDGAALGNISISGNTIQATNTNGGISLTPAGSGGTYITAGNLGIGTTSPGSKLSVAGNMFITGNIISTSTTASQFPYASTTALSAATLCLSNDCIASWPTYTDTSFSTTSANYWKSVNDFFSTTSTMYFTHSSTTIPKTYTSNTFTALQNFANASSTLFSASYASTTNLFANTASTSNLTISALQNGLLKVSATGVVSLATAGADFSTFAYPFPSNATSTLLSFDGGLTAYASSTIGNGAQAGGLTINGGATTTGSVSVGTYGVASTSLTVQNAYSMSGLGIESDPIGGASVGVFGLSTQVGGKFYGNEWGIVATGPQNLISGNLGVGTDPGSNKLHVTGNGLFEGEVEAQYFTATWDTASIFPYASTTALSATSLCLASDCRTSWPSGITYPFSLAGNATSTLTQFNGGLTAYASTTIGDGTQAGGLTINGGATTTGSLSVFGVTTRASDGDTGITLNSSSNFGAHIDLYAADGTTISTRLSGRASVPSYINNGSNVGIGTTTPWGALSITNTGTGPSFIVEDSASPDATPFIIDASGSVGIGTSSPSSKLSMHVTSGGESGSATPNGILIHDASTGSSWDVVNPFVVLDFSTNDASGAGAGTRGRIGMVMENIAGSRSRLGLFTESGSSGSFAERLTILGNTGNIGIGTTSPGSALSIQGNIFLAGNIVSTSTATSTFAGGLQTAALNVTATNATSTFANGLNLSGGCYAVGGVCLSSGASLSGSTGQIAYFSGTNTAVGTSTLFIESSGNIGINTTNPGATLDLVKDGGIIRSTFTTDTSSAIIQVKNDSTATLDMRAYGSAAAGTLLGQSRAGNTFLYADNTNLTVGTADANYLALSTSNLERLRITSSGTVGIGTSTPVHRLDVSDGSGAGAISMGADVNLTTKSASTRKVGRLVAPGYTTPTNSFLLIGADFTGATANNLFIGGEVGASTYAVNNIILSTADADNTTGGTERLRITGSGNVGVGTSTPWASLSVNSTAGTPQFVIGSSSTQFIVDKNGNIGIGNSNPLTALHIGGGTTATNFPDGAGGTFSPQILNSQTSGVAGIGMSVSDGVNNRRTGMFLNQTDGVWGLTQTYTTGSMPFVIMNGATEQLRITSVGRVGIGTSTPWANLSINSTAGSPQFVIGSSTTQFIVDKNGNIGIGTTMPSAQVDITKTLRVLSGPQVAPTTGRGIEFFYSSTSDRGEIFAYDRDGGGYQDLRINGLLFFASSTNVGIGSTTPWGKLSVTNATDDGPSFVVEDSASPDTTPFIITSGGNVGIGTSSPNIKLDVYGNTAQVRVSYPGSTSNGAIQVLNDTTASLRMLSYGSAAAGTTLGLARAGNVFLVSDAATLGIGSADANPLMLATNGTERLRIDSSGLVGIGTTTPISTLSVQGSLCVRSTGSCGATAGTIYATTAAISDIDLAENYRAIDSTLMAGEIVSLDTNTSSTIRRATKGEEALGVLSTKPGLLLGQEIKDGRAVALKGRVPLKVNMEGGPIAIGDRLTISSVPGVGTKATTSAYTVARALEATSVSGEIEVFVENEYTLVIEQRNALAHLLNATSTASSSPVFANIFARMTSWLADAGNGIAEIFAKTLRAENVYADTVNASQQICIGQTCIDEAQLIRMIEADGHEPSSQTPPPPTDDTPNDDESASPANEESPEDAGDDTDADTTDTEEPPIEESNDDSVDAPDEEPTL